MYHQHHQRIFVLLNHKARGEPEQASAKNKQFLRPNSQPLQPSNISEGRRMIVPMSSMGALRPGLKRGKKLNFHQYPSMYNYKPQHWLVCHIQRSKSCDGLYSTYKQYPAALPATVLVPVGISGNPVSVVAYVMKAYNMPITSEINPEHSYADEKFERFQEYYSYMNVRVKEPHNPAERSEIFDSAHKKLIGFIDVHIKDLKRLLFATDMALMSMVQLKINKKMDTSEAKIKTTQAKIPFGVYVSPEFKCLGTSYYIVSAHSQEDTQMILSSDRKPHCYNFRGAFAFTGFYHRHSETVYIGPHAEQFETTDLTQGLYCHTDDSWSEAQCIYKITPREEFPESVEYEPKVSYFCGGHRYFIPPTTDVRCVFSILSMNFVLRFGYEGVTYKSSDLSFMYPNGQVFYTDEPWSGMSCWNWACKWRHNQNTRSNEFFVS